MDSGGGLHWIAVGSRTWSRSEGLSIVSEVLLASLHDALWCSNTAPTDKGVAREDCEWGCPARIAEGLLYGKISGEAGPHSNPRAYPFYIPRVARGGGVTIQGCRAMLSQSGSVFFFLACEHICSCLRRRALPDWPPALIVSASSLLQPRHYANCDTSWYWEEVQKV